MNPNQPSREHIEARITALLLGELPAAEAQLLRWTISQDAALEKLQEELACTIVLVRETAKNSADVSGEKNVPLKLSDERRQKLLAHFKTPRPQPAKAAKELFWLKRIEVRSLVPTLVLLAIVALLAAISIPNFVKARATSKANAIVNNLRQIDAAKSQWALENNKPNDAVVTMDDLKPYLKNGGPQPVAGEKYIVGKVSDEVIADIDATHAKKIGELALRFPSGGQSDGHVHLSANDVVDENAAVAQPAVSAPATITVALAPVIAPTPAQIVLPSAESPAPTDPANGRPVVLGNAGVISQNVVGYANVQPPASVATMPADSFAIPNSAIVTDTRFGGTGGFSGGGAGGGGAGGEETYFVKSGDTLTKIARAHGTTIQALEEANNLPSTKIFAGAKMRVPAEPAALPASGSDLVAFAPVVAPPPAQIFLPQAESAPEVALQTGSQPNPDDYQKVLTVTPAHALDSEGSSSYWSRKSDGKPASPEVAQILERQRTIAASDQNGGTTFGGTGGSSGGSSPSLTIQNDFGVNRSRTENAPQNLGDELRRQAPTGAASATFALREPEVVGALTQEKLPEIALNTIEGETSVDRKLKVENSGQVLADGGRQSQMRATSEITVVKNLNQNENAWQGSLAASEQNFFRQPARETAAEKDKVASGDMPVAGRLFGSSASSSGVVAKPAENYSGHKFQSYDGITTDDVSGIAGELGKSSDGALALNGNNAYAGGTAVSGGSLTMNESETASGRAAGKSGLDLGAAEQENRDQNGYAFNNGNPQQAAPVLKNMLQSKRTARSTEAVSQKRALQQRAQNIATTMSDNKTSARGGGGGFGGFGGATAEAGSPGTASSAVINNGTLNSANISMDPTTHNLIVIADEATKDNIRQVVASLGAATVIPPSNVVQLALTNAIEMNDGDKIAKKISLPAPIPQPEFLCTENNFSTFSLNVSDVSFKLAAASLERGQMPDAASIRSEEFINAFDYRDPEATAGQPLAFASERARYPFAQNRDLLRFSVKTAAAGRQAGRALNLVLLLDNSGSMERADRVEIIREALRVLASQLQPQDTVSVVTFARTARLWADGVSGDKAGETLSQVGGITPEGGTNLEEALRLAYETARRHYLANGINRVVLLTDGAANLGNVDPAALKKNVEAQRQQGIALDCFGIGFEDYDDNLLEELSGNGDGRYAFLNSPEDTSKEFAAKLAGALQVAAQDVKVQVEFNPQRVISWRQIGYAKHQLTKEQFRDNTVLAAEIAAQEAGNALYTVETKPDGTGPIATVRVRYKIPSTTDVTEHEFEVPYTGNAISLEQSSAAMRLAATAGAFSEWLAASPFAQEVSPDELLKNLSGVPEIYGADERPKQLEWMIRQAKNLSGK